MGNEKVLLATEAVASMQRLSEDIDQLDKKRIAILAEAEKELESAKVESQRMLIEAQAEVKKLLDEAELKIQEERQTALEEAQRIGYESGKEEAAREAKSFLDEAERTLKHAKEEADMKIAAVEPHMVQLLKGLVSKVIGTQVKYNDDVLIFMIRRAFSELKLSKSIKVKVGREQYTFLKDNKSMLYSGISEDTEIEIIEDQTMLKGDCIIETPAGNLDVSVKDQIKGVREYLDLIALEE